MKTKALLREITQAGGVYLRQRGSHRYFRLPDGQRVMVPVSGAHLDVSTGAEQKVRRALALLLQAKGHQKP